MVMRKMILAGVALLALPMEGSAQLPEAAAARFRATSVGYSWHASRGPRWGSIVNRRLYLLGFARETRLTQGRDWELRRTFEIPVALVQRTSDQTEYCYVTQRDPGGWVCERDSSHDMALGVGVLPLGVQWQTAANAAMQFHVRVAGGAMAFSNPTPVNEATHANFVLEAGGGFTFRRPLGREVTIGYKLHHLSNAGLGTKNPGLDSNVLYVSVRRQSQ